MTSAGKRILPMVRLSVYVSVSVSVRVCPYTNIYKLCVCRAVSVSGLANFDAKIDSWLVLTRPVECPGIIVAHVFGPDSPEAGIFNGVNSSKPSNKRARDEDDSTPLVNPAPVTPSQPSQPSQVIPEPVPCLMRALLLVGMQRSLDMCALRYGPKLPEAIASTIDSVVDPASSLNARVHTWFWDQGIRTVE